MTRKPLTRITLALVLLNELRGLLVAASILAASGWDMAAILSRFQ